MSYFGMLVGLRKWRLGRRFQEKKEVYREVQFDLGISGVIRNPKCDEIFYTVFLVVLLTKSGGYEKEVTSVACGGNKIERIDPVEKGALKFLQCPSLATSASL